MELPDFLNLDADGEVRFKEHGLRIIDVAARFREGHSPEGMRSTSTRRLTFGARI